MAARGALNKNNSAVKRIMQEARELANDPCTDYSAAPLEDDIFEWHCTMRGPSGTEFEGGLYHFRILLPSEYPFRPPSIMMLTPNGRFELNTKICISFTNYHEELWQPAWGVRTAIIGLQGFFPLKGTAAAGVGAIEYPNAERKRLAALSRNWICPRCNHSNLECLPDPLPAGSASVSDADLSISDTPSPRQLVVPMPTPAATPFMEATSASESSSSTNTPLSTASPLDTPSTPSTPSIRLHAPIPTRPSPPASILSQRIPTPRLQIIKSDLLGRPSASPARTPDLPILEAAITQSQRRPPVMLDTAICVLLVLVLSLIARRIL
ncbi:hypothetical protein POSPLADRAFT_1038887 [Postia placenta MAD-698-R-SB12]|uniref:UBC core domain-containing protein n=1 Tax=Postia placenta MAD-698-R-SB12 TaxID=670580 RepID=A0A1X6N8Q7_9APHY|nr:hypothetical protein POSPLADRAFT_1038887 [Postia placenta MAD-698-R-SB12]OSX64991.1 hypothetical protein POSPLADRAFT_1038887 [Postia placenta MAD-698-R-SB12]